jgi:hypothetical protein
MRPKSFPKGANYPLDSLIESIRFLFPLLNLCYGLNIFWLTTGIRVNLTSSKLSLVFIEEPITLIWESLGTT